MDQSGTAGRDVTVVLVVKDEPSIQRSLELLEPQCRDAGASCIVVDASEGRLADIEEAVGWVRWIHYRQPPNRRFTIAHQRNVGVRAATTSRVAFCDAGLEPADDWLESLLDYLDADPSSAWCGPIVSTDTPPLKTVAGGADGQPLFLACTANMGFHRSLFDRVGGFDERYDHAEDIDFGWRIGDVGSAVRCASRSTMEVRWGGREQQVRRAFRYGRSVPLLLLRNPRHVGAYCRTLPDDLLYPAWLAGLVAAVAVSRRPFRASLGWMCGLLVPLAKNPDEPDRATFLLRKLARAVGILSAMPTAISEWRSREARPAPRPPVTRP